MSTLKTTHTRDDIEIKIDKNTNLNELAKLFETERGKLVNIRLTNYTSITSMIIGTVKEVKIYENYLIIRLDERSIVFKPGEVSVIENRGICVISFNGVYLRMNELGE